VSDPRQGVAVAVGGSLSSALAWLGVALPTGRTLPAAAWRSRHRKMVLLLLVEAVGLGLFSLAQGGSTLHATAHAAILIPLGLAALRLEHRRREASVLVSLGLITACALLVHIWDGAIEGHFLFFVMIVVLSLYEDWLPFLVAAAYVVIHHGLAGAIDPSAVYNHPDAIAHPWKWAAIHGGFVVAAGLASVAAWRFNETVRAQAQDAYRRASESEERFKGAFDDAPIGMVLFAADRGGAVEVLRVNRAMCEITGHPDAALRSRALHDGVHRADVPVVADAVEQLMGGSARNAQLEVRYLHATGRTVWVSVSVSLLRDGKDDRGYAIAQIQDVTESKLAGEELVRQALEDSLTGLGNRRRLIADLENELQQASTVQPLLLLLFDLDGFKTYNDTFGHPAGDLLLTRVARRLEATLGDRASAYRVGGDEFCVLSTQPADRLAAEAAAALAERGEGFQVTASYGSVLLPIEAADATQALRIADRRMYARKSLDSRTSAGRQSADVLLRILSERSPALGVHLDEVTGLCNAVAEQLGVSEEDRAPLLQAASLHDAGKAAIPDGILHKPGRLDGDEREFVRRHTVIGERILSAAPALARAARLVRWSHERFDGGGYPDGLVGEQIPLGSRIIAVCDAYDAMICDRPEDAPIGAEEARAALRRGAGTEFDPGVVEVFCDVLEQRERDTVGEVPVPDRGARALTHLRLIT
jgi:diguanylate cyclase (GGDEF)-like protein/PAS domain S-box-containing protein